MSSQDRERPGVSRRGFLKGVGAGAAASAAVGSLTGAAKAAVRSEAGLPAAEVLSAKDTHPVQLTLNGRQVTVQTLNHHTLLQTLREGLDMTGAKLVCDAGTCGACTVLLDGHPTNACLTLTIECEGADIQTIEGLEKDGELHPIQEAFIAEDALQCGFCTPGMVMCCKALLESNPKPSLDETKEALAGNICRCGTYVNIFRAVDRASRTMTEGR